MSTSEPTPEQLAQLRTSFESFVHTTSLLTLVVAPVLILLPPRKIDFYTFSLAGAFTLAGSHLWSERQERLGRNRIRAGDWALPSKAMELQTHIKQKRVLDEQPIGVTTGGNNQISGSLLEERAKEVWLRKQTAGTEWKDRQLDEKNGRE